MWKEKAEWHIEWGGANIWGQDYTGSAYFFNESEAKTFLKEVKQHEGINFICYQKSIVMRKENLNKPER